MIDPEILRQTTAIITHTNADRPCADGRASALIALDALPDVEVRFVQYNSPEHLQLEAKPGLLFLDFTPPRERVQEFVDAGAVVLDHHAHARDIVEAFGERGVYSGEPGVSGAVLAFREVWQQRATRSGHGAGAMREAEIADFATLIGRRDTWQRSDPRWREACARSAEIAFYPWDRLVRALNDHGPRWLGGLLEVGVGEAILEHEEEHARRLLAGAAEVGFGELDALLFDGGSHEANNVSDIAPPHVGLVVGWHYSSSEIGDRMTVHLRSRSGLDVGAIAKPLGGGGHVGAAGFTVDVDHSKSPIRQIIAMLGPVVAHAAG